MFQTSQRHDSIRKILIPFKIPSTCIFKHLQVILALESFLFTRTRTIRNHCLVDRVSVSYVEGSCFEYGQSHCNHLLIKFIQEPLPFNRGPLVYKTFQLGYRVLVALIQFIEIMKAEWKLPDVRCHVEVFNIVL